jgi:ABC-type transporter Mla subunit MlaD
MPDSARWLAIVAATSAVALSGCGGSSGCAYRILLHASTALKSGSPVRISGHRHGTVNDVALTRGARALLLKFTVEKQAGRLHTDARAVIHPDGIDLTPGSPSAPVIPNTGYLPASQVHVVRPAP